MSARLASPTEPGLWWRYEGSEAPVLCYAHELPLGVMGAHGIVHAIWYSTVARDGVRWARCVPPADDAERDDLAASLDTARGERDEAREEITALRARVEALEESAAMACVDPRAGCDCAGCLYARAKGGDHE